MMTLNVSLLSFLCIASAYYSNKTNAVTAGTELVFAFMVHRHGDRTPIKETLSLFLGKEDERLKSLIEPWGYGHLTDVGKQTGYKTGQFIRRRYNGLIAEKYNKSEMYIRSTDSTRTMLTVITAMTAVYPVNDSDSDNVEIPTIIDIVPAKYDYNLAFLNCPKFDNNIANLIQESRSSNNSNLVDRFSRNDDDEIKNISPFLIFGMYDAIVSLRNLGYRLPIKIDLFKDQISRSADKAIDKVWGDSKYLHFQAGVLLNEFFENADKIIRCEDTPKVRIYSAHDFNVYSLEAISRAVPRQGVPKYGSLFSLELRRVMTSGQYIVLPVYLADPNDGAERYLHIDGCGDVNLCDYEKFRALTASDLRSEEVWRNECGFTEDMDFDTSSID